MSGAARQGRTGAGTGRNAPAATRVGVQNVTHRGIRWQRAPSGAIRWWNDELERWVRFQPGADAPPRPAGWETGRAPDPPLTRPKWRSPYRIVPIVLVVVVVVSGLVQALRSNQPVADEAKQAAALNGRCLRETGTSKGSPTYSDKPVPCSAANAAVKVVAVVTTTPPATPCPAGTTAVQLLSGVAHPHLECVEPVQH
ncbi:MAG TPA: hypothetical protein VG184_12715 [Acidimicrobiales bacterium]|nr:hypothetical protein [Acidimicrobiales bacterium]